ncbi:hypothetical protein AB0J38_00205 [Streptomyces sp. NPDC050095]|uniref:hypothetical protein n=1 Tax=unclassified Streptomyces TaxID=2593676 RepID=UPI003436D1D7
MIPVAIAAVLTMSVVVLILSALVVTMALRVLPPRPAYAVAMEREAQRRAYRYATDAEESRLHGDVPRGDMGGPRSPRFPTGFAGPGFA